jgi:hypothetical protein
MHVFAPIHSSVVSVVFAQTHSDQTSEITSNRANPFSQRREKESEQNGEGVSRTPFVCLMAVLLELHNGTQSYLRPSRNNRFPT